jgi:hypothetical protein
MNESTTESTSPLRGNSPAWTYSEASSMAMCTSISGEASGRTEHLASKANRNDANITRLRKLRDYYKQTSQPREVKAIERAIVVLREAM